MAEIYRTETVVGNGDYQNNLIAKSKEILNGKETISLKNLKQHSLFANIYNKLSNVGKTRIDSIAKMDGDGKTVSLKELNTIFTVLDANKQEISRFSASVLAYKTEIGFAYDEKHDVTENNGIYTLSDEDVQYIYDNTSEKIEEDTNPITKYGKKFYEQHVSKQEEGTNSPLYRAYEKYQAEHPTNEDTNKFERLYEKYQENK